MSHRLDQIMYSVSVIYIALPIYLFITFWLRPLVAIPVGFAFVVSCLLMIRNKPLPVKWHVTWKTVIAILVCLFILIVWLSFSGLGGLSFQNADYHYRNAIFHDLINRSWPVLYDSAAQAGQAVPGTSDGLILTYYIAFWLPAAIVGKAFGWVAANRFLFFWALIGCVLIVYYLFRTLRSVNVWAVLVMVFFSGADILGFLWLKNGQWPGFLDHIEWWSGFQYSSNTTLLFWVFNQTIVIWLAILLVLNLPNSRSLFFLYSMLLLHGPFPFIGMFPIIMWKAYEGHALRLQGSPAAKWLLVFAQWFWGGIRRALTFENLCGGISVLVICYLYLSNNVSGQTSGTNSITNFLILFLFVEAGFFLMVIYIDYKKSPLYWLCLVSLLLIPLFRIGGSQDFCMRVSIPLLFMIHIFVQKSLFGKKEQTDRIESDTRQADTQSREQIPQHTFMRGHQIRKVLLVVLLVIGMVVPLQEIGRSVTYTLLYYPKTNDLVSEFGEDLLDSRIPAVSQYGQVLAYQEPGQFLQADSVGSLSNNIAAASNFTGPVRDNLFYMYLARHD
jgi:hypothetical protein